MTKEELVVIITSHGVNADTANLIASGILDKFCPDKKERSTELYNRIKARFLEFYQFEKGIPFYFTPADGAAIKSLIKKIEFLSGKDEISDDLIFDFFSIFLKKITDKWVLDNLTLRLINSRFNELVSQIKSKQKNGKHSENAINNAVVDYFGG